MAVGADQALTAPDIESSDDRPVRAGLPFCDLRTFVALELTLFAIGWLVADLSVREGRWPVRSASVTLSDGRRIPIAGS